MHCHRILVSALFVDMSYLFTSFISKKYFNFHWFLLVFVHCQIYFFKYDSSSSGSSSSSSSKSCCW